ncbi:MAG TPA: NEW3 domain-containing protein [candidate division Zixibacteria bacterium]|nr:NEW3 domain-containing protein [candidate division Zixibacteria bacterium]
MSSYRHRIFITFLIIATLAGGAFAQTYNPFNQRDDEYRLLGLKRAREAYEVARSDYERQQELHRRGLLTETELEQSRSQFSDAEVNYQQSLLAVLFERQYISVSQAVKLQKHDGSKCVRLTLVNTSGGSEEFRKLLNVDDDLFRSLQPDVTHNVYVSILNDDNAIISQPYEAKISELRYGEPQSVEFRLLQDLDEVTVFLVYGNGNQRTMKIFLQKDATYNRVAVQSEQFSQEVELGTEATFDLTLELFSGTDNTFSLEAVNLPQQISRYFKDASNRVRLSQVKFTESSRTKNASLEVTLPDRPSEEVAMDAAIPFYVLVLPRDKAGMISDQPDKHWTEAEIEALDVGFVRLELVPRGKGELLVRAPQLYHAISSDETAKVAVDCYNEGSHRLDNVEFEIDLPLGWTRDVEPERIPALEIGRDKRVVFTFTPPADVSPGKYDIRIRSTATSNSQPVIADDKTVTVEIKPGSNLLGTIVIVTLILGLVAAIVIWGIKLSRR